MVIPKLIVQINRVIYIIHIKTHAIRYMQTHFTHIFINIHTSNIQIEVKIILYDHTSSTKHEILKEIKVLPRSIDDTRIYSILCGSCPRWTHFCFMHMHVILRKQTQTHIFAFWCPPTSHTQAWIEPICHGSNINCCGDLST